jgi:hypothetical protein
MAKVKDIVSGLYLVHQTPILPVNGVMQPGILRHGCAKDPENATLAEKVAAQHRAFPNARFTTHWHTHGLVQSHAAYQLGVEAGAHYAILVPVKDALPAMYGGYAEDWLISGRFTLPQSAIILVPKEEENSVAVQSLKASFQGTVKSYEPGKSLVSAVEELLIQKTGYRVSISNPKVVKTVLASNLRHPNMRAGLQASDWEISLDGTEFIPGNTPAAYELLDKEGVESFVMRLPVPPAKMTVTLTHHSSQIKKELGHDDFFAHLQGSQRLQNVTHSESCFAQFETALQNLTFLLIRDHHNASASLDSLNLGTVVTNRDAFMGFLKHNQDELKAAREEIKKQLAGKPEVLAEFKQFERTAVIWGNGVITHKEALFDALHKPAELANVIASIRSEVQKKLAPAASAEQGNASFVEQLDTLGTVAEQVTCRIM